MPTANTRSAHDVFAALLRVLAPYASDVVLIGGWVHALYLARASARGESDGIAVLTDDFDITIPRHLEANGRPQLIELVTEIGFERDPISDLDGAPVMLRQMIDKSLVDLDILTESPDPRATVRVEGQVGLHIAGYPGQQILLENTEWMSVGVDLHPSLAPPIEIRVPTLPAYVFHKGLSSSQRVNEQKRSKDLVYMVEIIRHGTLGPIALAGLADIGTRYPAFYVEWKRYLNLVLNDRILLRMVADQLLLAGQSTGTEAEVVSAVARRIQRALLDAAGAN
jgi:hypothetical protein